MVEAKDGPARRLVPFFVFWLLVEIAGSVAVAQRARAFSDPLAYTDPVDVGGGAGRWFTGSTADGYGCDVCHRGRAGAAVTVSGLPTAGYVPGQAYEIAVAWPGGLPVAALAEFTDEHKQGAGQLALPRPDALTVFELCSPEQGGAIPSAVHEATGGRELVSLVDCGANTLRFQWTAPPTAAGVLWFDAGLVTSNEDATPDGDGVTLVRRAIPLLGSAATQRAVAVGCGVTAPPRRARVWTLGAFALGLALAGRSRKVWSCLNGKSR